MPSYDVNVNVTVEIDETTIDELMELAGEDGDLEFEIQEHLSEWLEVDYVLGDAWACAIDVGGAIS